MKIRRTVKSSTTLVEFAEAHDLILHSLERIDASINANKRFRVAFDDCMVNVPLLGLQPKYGFGSTEVEAIKAYAANLEGQPLHILRQNPPTIITCPPSLSYP